MTRPAARIYIMRALEAAMAAHGYPVDAPARYKYEVRRALAEEIDRLRIERESSRYAAHFPADAQGFETSADLGLVFEEQGYAYNQPYKGARKFKKHYFPIIGDLKDGGEGFRCAVHLDEHPKVRFWVRNVDRKPNAFWLQLPGGRFYPDFMAMLTDGRIGAVEYNGGHLVADSADKRRIGALWAEASGGLCVFAMPTAGDFGAIERAMDGP